MQNNDIYPQQPAMPQGNPPRKGGFWSGCLMVVGALMTLAGVLVILFAVLVGCESERAQQERIRKNQEYYAQHETGLWEAEGDSLWGDAVEEDSASREQEVTDEHVATDDSAETVATDSLVLDDGMEESVETDSLVECEPPPSVGFNIGGAFALLFGLVGLVPLFMGVGLFCFGLLSRRR